MKNGSGSWKFLASRLLNHLNHPKGRNTYTHVSICVKGKFKFNGQL